MPGSLRWLVLLPLLFSLVAADASGRGQKTATARALGPGVLAGVSAVAHTLTASDAAMLTLSIAQNSLLDHVSGGRHAPVGAPAVVGRRQGGGVTDVVEGSAQFAGTAVADVAEKRAAVPGMRRVCGRLGRPDYAVLVSGTEPADGHGW